MGGAARGVQRVGAGRAAQWTERGGGMGAGGKSLDRFPAAEPEPAIVKLFKQTDTDDSGYTMSTAALSALPSARVESPVSGSSRTHRPVWTMLDALSTAWVEWAVPVIEETRERVKRVKRVERETRRESREHAEATARAPGSQVPGPG